MNQLRKITAMAEEEYASGTENMQILFPAPVVILIKKNIMLMECRDNGL